MNILNSFEEISIDSEKSSKEQVIISNQSHNLFSATAWPFIHTDVNPHVLPWRSQALMGVVSIEPLVSNWSDKSL